MEYKKLITNNKHYSRSIDFDQNKLAPQQQNNISPSLTPEHYKNNKNINNNQAVKSSYQQFFIKNTKK